MSSEQERLTALETNDKNQDACIKQMAEDIKEIKDKLLLRPSWSVSAIITLLTGICVGLIVFVATNF